MGTRSASIIEAIAELAKRCLIWNAATEDVRCPGCGRRLQRSKAAELLAEQTRLYASLLNRNPWPAEAPTVPRTPMRKSP